MLLWIGFLLSAFCAGASYYLAYLGFSLHQNSRWLFLASGFFLTTMTIGLLHRLWSSRHRQADSPVIFVNHIKFILIITISLTGIIATIILNHLWRTG